MVNPVVIGIAGTHSTGKSTFCNDLKESLEPTGVSVATIPSFGNLAVEQGIPLLTKHTYDSTMWFIDRTLEAQQAANAEVLLVDRPIIDAVAYWNAAVEYRGETVTSHEIDSMDALILSHCSDYTEVVATKLDTSVTLGPGRDTNSHFRELVDTHLHKLLGHLGIKHSLLFPQVRDSLLAELHVVVFQRMGLS